MKDSIIYGDALCFVLSPNRTRHTVNLVLNKFIPGYRKIEGDYAFNSTTDLTFEDEEGILRYLEKTTTERGTIHWNKENDNPDNVMIGAYFTTDGQLIFSLTILGDGNKEEKYLDDLKLTLDSNIGVIYYNQFPDFENGEDFRNKYGLQQKI
jgi:hypothetical protein